jgi:hypothetical protein
MIAKIQVQVQIQQLLIVILQQRVVERHPLLWKTTIICSGVIVVIVGRRA